jgi:hypothetical protein
MKKVNLFIVGAAKAGTTSLWSHFSKHPDVFTTSDELHKEPAFLSDYGVHMGSKKYHALFSGSEYEKYICDASTSYLTSSESARRIYEYNPESKVICLLRNPIDRAYSLIIGWLVMVMNGPLHLKSH